MSGLELFELDSVFAQVRTWSFRTPVRFPLYLDLSFSYLSPFLLKPDLFFSNLSPLFIQSGPQLFSTWVRSFLCPNVSFSNFSPFLFMPWLKLFGLESLFLHVRTWDSHTQVRAWLISGVSPISSAKDWNFLGPKSVFPQVRIWVRFRQVWTWAFRTWVCFLAIHELSFSYLSLFSLKSELEQFLTWVRSSLRPNLSVSNIGRFYRMSRLKLFRL